MPIFIADRMSPRPVCPSEKTIEVTVDNTVQYNTIDFANIGGFFAPVPNHVSHLKSISPATVFAFVAKIGTSEEVTVTVNFTSGPTADILADQVLPEAVESCRFRVFYTGRCLMVRVDI